MRRKEKLENDFFDNHRDTDLNVVSYYIKNAKFLNLLCNKSPRVHTQMGKLSCSAVFYQKDKMRNT